MRAMEIAVILEWTRRAGQALRPTLPQARRMLARGVLWSLVMLVLRRLR